MARMNRSHQPFRSVSDVPLQSEVGQPIRGGLDQDGGAQAHHRNGRVPRGRGEHHQPQAARQDRAIRRSRWKPASPTTRPSRTGRISVNDFASHSITSLGEFRKNITLDVFNEAGQKALSYNLYRCWVSEYQALPDLDAGANAVAITTIKLEYEWFERDLAVVELQGPAALG